MADKSRIAELAEKWLNGTISEAEKQEFDHWYNNELEKNPEWTRDISRAELERRLLSKITSGNKALASQPAKLTKTKGSRKIFRRLSAAAAVILVAIGVWYFQFQNKQYEIIRLEGSANISLPPGRNAATLTLNDGSVIDLEAAHNGEISTQGEASINKQNGQLAYIAPTVQDIEPPRFNTVRTARGNQFQLVLSDDTKVWLNSESSLRFPAVFHNNERIVELTGEAYFEVAKNAGMPFRVRIDSVEVEVLGTHFNINAYKDELGIKTTLIEGEVKVSKNEEAVRLSPGEQAEIKWGGGAFTKRQADIEKEMAWQEGFFEFDNTELQPIMRQISRWYDVDIRYEGQPTAEKFGGRISKDLNLGNILTLLETSGVQFTLEGETLIVKPSE